MPALPWASSRGKGGDSNPDPSGLAPAALPVELPPTGLPQGLTPAQGIKHARRQTVNTNPGQTVTRVATSHRGRGARSGLGCSNRARHNTSLATSSVSQISVEADDRVLLACLYPDVTRPRHCPVLTRSGRARRSASVIRRESRAVPSTPSRSCRESRREILPRARSSAVDGTQGSRRWRPTSAGGCRPPRSTVGR